MDSSIKLKEALKVAFAFALVYGIALKINWISPSWAGWSVIAISALPGGQSLQKGLLRICGTILACFIGVTIISIGAQERWLFMFLTAAWLSFCTYQMLSNKKISYFWFVAGYVTLVITAAGPSSAGGFYIAIFRTLETILGIVVYTLVAVFIWPLSNMGSIKKSLKTLVITQTKLLQATHDLLIGTLKADQLQKLRQTYVKEVGQFSKSLVDEGVENYEVQELKPLWDRFESLNNGLLKCFDRLIGGIEDLSQEALNNNAELDHFFTELNYRFCEMSHLLSGQKVSLNTQHVELSASAFKKLNLSHFDKAALSIIIHELNKIESISAEMVQLALEIKDSVITEQKTHKIQTIKTNRWSDVKVLDVEYLKGALFVGATIIAGFIIWFYVNPPGHASWYIMGGVFSLIFAGAPPIKTIKLIIPFLLAMFLVSLIYVFVLPQLSSFYMLGMLLFTSMFVIKFVFPGAVSLVFTIVFLQLLAINNPQTFDDSALVNSFVFIALFFVFLFGMSYIINAPRPEKKVIKLLSRFFKSAQYLVAIQTNDLKTKDDYIHRFKTSFYIYELHALPAKIKVWGKAIDKKLFPGTDFQQIDEMTDALEVFVVRMEILLDAKNNTQEKDIIVFKEILIDWQARLENVFDSWDNINEVHIKNNMNQQISNWLNQLDEKLKKILSRNEGAINKEEAIQFYKLIGGYRGLSEATLSFVKLADKMDWKQWKEERFQ